MYATLSVRVCAHSVRSWRPESFLELNSTKDNIIRRGTSTMNKVVF